MITEVAFFIFKLIIIMTYASAWMGVIFITIFVAGCTGLLFYGLYKNIKSWIIKGYAHY